jgi:hypothetical protein
MTEFMTNKAIEEAAIAFVIRYEEAHGRHAHDTRRRGATTDILSDGRIIEVKAFGKTARGDFLWLEVNQVNEALSNPDFHLYLVENVRQGDPAQFRLIDLWGEDLSLLLARRREKHYFEVPFPTGLYDRLVAKDTEL